MSATASGPFLLVARPSLLDPNFRRTVVLILRHDAEGSFGLVLNRALDGSLGDVLPEIDRKGVTIPLFQGGPVQPGLIQFLNRSPEYGTEVVDGVSVVVDLQQLLCRPAQGREIRAYVGYAGWNAGQLEAELAQGSWVMAPASARMVFDVSPERLWATTLHELGGRYRWMALKGVDPHHN